MSQPILPICVRCNIEMRPDTNGVTALLMAYDPPQPYEAYDADLVKCPNCGLQVIVGCATQAFWMHFYDAPTPDSKVFPVYENIKDIPTREEQPTS